MSLLKQAAAAANRPLSPQSGWPRLKGLVVSLHSNPADGVIYFFKISFLPTRKMRLGMAKSAKVTQVVSDKGFTAVKNQFQVARRSGM